MRVGTAALGCPDKRSLAGRVTDEILLCLFRSASQNKTKTFNTENTEVHRGDATEVLHPGYIQVRGLEAHPERDPPLISGLPL